MNPSEIIAVMKEIGGGANKRLGQHFLIDKHALETIVAEAEIKLGDRVLEVGPGLGVLTRALIESGARVTAIERDRRFISYLKTNLPPVEGGTKGGPLHGDAADLDWDKVIKVKNWKFVSNLPYSITSLALRKALYAKHPPTNIVVLVQREVAERAIGGLPLSKGEKKRGSLLSLMVAFATHEARIVKRVSAGCFFPPPKVESAILRLIPMSQAERLAIWGRDPEEIMAVAKRGFAHPRKLLASNLKLSSEQRLKIVEAGINEKARAEDLKPEDWVRIAERLS